MALICKQCTKQMFLLRSIYRKPVAIKTPLEVVSSSNLVSCNTYFSSTKDSKNDDEDGSPVKFTTSEASQWKASYSRMGEKEDDTPPWQPYIVLSSAAAFLIYFLVLREENDIDIKLGGGNFDSIETYVEYIQLKTIVEHNEQNNLETDESTLMRFKELKKLDGLPYQL